MDTAYYVLGVFVFWMLFSALAMTLFIFIAFATAHVLFDRGLFGYRIEKANGDREYHRIVWARACEARRWFSQYRDLDVIWDYLFKGEPRTVDEARSKYARARASHESAIPTLCDCGTCNTCLHGGYKNV